MLTDMMLTFFVNDRLKVLKEEPYTQKEAERAAGLGTDNGKGRETATSVSTAPTAMEQ